MDSIQLRQCIIEPVLKDLELYSQEAVDLICGTALIESVDGKYLTQIKGPAKGIYQCEPDTLVDIWNNYIKYRPGLLNAIKKTSMTPQLDIDEIPCVKLLIGNLYFATAICRIHYLRAPEKIPSPQADKNKYAEELARYYKQYYNTNKGACELDTAVKMFTKIVWGK